MACAPDPDMIIRTGCEQRTSNFMLWQSVYAEICFTETLWSAFDAAEMGRGLAWYAQWVRRFG